MDKKYIEDKQGNRILPITHVSAVLDNDGNDVVSLLGTKQDTLSAGTGIEISGNVISATGGGGGANVKQELSSANEEHPILIKNDTTSATTTSQTYFSSGVYINPSSNTLSVDGSIFINKGGTNHNRSFGFKKTENGTNIDIGWDYIKRDGAGAFFRSSDYGLATQVGAFGFYARSSNRECTLVGDVWGDITWNGNNILHAGNAGSMAYEDKANYLPISGGTLTGSTIFNNGCFYLAGVENCDITNKHWNTDTLYNNANTEVLAIHTAIRNAIRFRWYDTYWNIGNIRGGADDTYGFGIALEDTVNERLIDCFRVTSGAAYVAGNTILHAGNSSVGKTGDTLSVTINGNTETISGGMTSGDVQSMIESALTPISETIEDNEEVTAQALNELNDAVSANTTSLGGLSLVKLTESEYQSLSVKDPDTLYVVTPDPTNP